MRNFSILFLAFCGLAGFSQKNVTIKSFSYSDCDHSCSGQKVTFTDLKNNTLKIKFVLQAMCTSVFYGQVLKSGSDTLRLKVNSDKQGFKAGSQQAFFELKNCLCYYNLEMTLLNVKQMPKVVIVNDEFSDAYFGFIPFDFYARTFYKNFFNDAADLSFDYIKEAIGNKKSSNAFKKICEALKKDSMEYLDDGELSVEFPAEEIAFGFNREGELNQVDIRNTYSGPLPLKLSFKNDIKDVEKILGLPDKKTIYYSTRYDTNAVAKKSPGTSKYYYSDFTLQHQSPTIRIDFEESGKISHITFYYKIYDY